MDARQVESIQQQRQLFGTQGDLAASAGRLRPVKTAAFQALGADPESAAIPDQSLDPRAAAVGEQEQMAAERILSEMITDQAEQTLEAFPHIDGFGGQIDAGGRTGSEHLALARQLQQLRQGRWGEVPVAFDADAVGQQELEPAAGCWSAIEVGSRAGVRR